MRAFFPPSSVLEALLLVAAASFWVSCRSPDVEIIPQERLAPDVIASVDFTPSRLKRVGVLPFVEGEGSPWEEDFPQSIPKSVAMDGAERFSASISKVADFEVVPPDRIASLIPRDTLEVTTRKQVIDLCRRLGLDAIFRGRLEMVAEGALAGSGEVYIPFTFVSLEVELLDAGTGEIVWFANHHVNSFQFLDKKITISTGDPGAAERRLADSVPGYPDVDRTLTILAELAIAEVAGSFAKSCSEAASR